MGARNVAPSPSLSEVGLDIRVRYRERATREWLVALLVGAILVAAALLVGSTGPVALVAIGVYSLVALFMAVRSGILLARLRA
jgi:general stress protein CsbA